MVILRGVEKSHLHSFNLRHWLKQRARGKHSVEVSTGVGVDLPIIYRATVPPESWGTTWKPLSRKQVRLADWHPLLTSLFPQLEIPVDIPIPWSLLLQ